MERIGLNKQLRLSPGHWKPRAQNYANGPRCPFCRSTDVRPFSAIYGLGTTTYHSRRGLIIPSHFQKTRRQTILASKCAPPARFPWWPAVLAFAFAGCCRFLPSLLPAWSGQLMNAGYWLLWAALTMAVIAAVENYIFHQERMARWARKILCRKCGTAFQIGG